MDRIRQPAIILARPQMGENIGAAARAMANFGLSDLRLVAPRDVWPNERAYAMAANAKDIIDQVQLYDTLDQALHDCHHAYATTARSRSVDMPVDTPRTAMQHYAAHDSQKIAYVFGAENNGLLNEELSWCHAIMTIPCAAYRSCNLAQAVMVVAYEWFGAVNGSTVKHISDAEHNIKPIDYATVEESAMLYQQLKHMLEQSSGFYGKPKFQQLLRHVRHDIMQAGMTSTQVRRWHSIMKALKH